MGALLVIGLVIGSALLMGGSSGPSKDCGRITMGGTAFMAKLPQLAALQASLAPDSSGFEAISRVMQILVPSCSWTRETQATLIGVNGKVVEWSEVVLIVGDQTFAQLNESTALAELFDKWTPGKEGAASPTVAQAAAKFVGAA
jgi:hypothetical protein